MKVGMAVLFRAGAYNGHPMAVEVEIPELEKNSNDTNEDQKGKICQWFAENGYGMVKTPRGKMVPLNWRNCPSYADQYEIKIGMDVKFKLGEYDGKPTALGAEIPELKLQIGRRRHGRISKWDVDNGYGMIEAESGKSFRANWRELPSYVQQADVTSGMRVVFLEGEYEGNAAAKSIGIPCMIPMVGSKVRATDNEGDWFGFVKRISEDGSCMIDFEGEVYPSTQFKSIIVEQIPQPQPQRRVPKPLSSKPSIWAQKQQINSSPHISIIPQGLPSPPIIPQIHNININSNPLTNPISNPLISRPSPRPHDPMTNPISIPSIANDPHRYSPLISDAQAQAEEVALEALKEDFLSPAVPAINSLPEGHAIPHVVEMGPTDSIIPTIPSLPTSPIQVLLEPGEQIEKENNFDWSIPIKDWDTLTVCAWASLVGVKEEAIGAFQQEDITGEDLLELDKEYYKELNDAVGEKVFTLGIQKKVKREIKECLTRQQQRNNNNNPFVERGKSDSCV